MSTSPIFIPVFNFGDITPDNVIGQILLQLFAVSASEESLKIAMAIAVSFITRSRATMIGISVAAWSAMHGILAVPIG